MCLDVSAMGGPVKLFQCHGLGGNQKWEYDRQVFSPIWSLFTVVMTTYISCDCFQTV